MSKARAAKIWAELERELVGLLLSGSRLDVLRPQLIRLIGNTLGGGERGDGEEEGQRQTQGQRQKQRQKQERQVKRIGVIPRGIYTARDDTTHDAVLAAMLERSCSLRAGYVGVDEVTYARSR